MTVNGLRNVWITGRYIEGCSWGRY